MEGGFVRALQGGTAGKGGRTINGSGGGEGYVHFRRNSSLASANERRDGNVSDFASIIPPGVGTTVYQEVASRGFGAGTEQYEGINYGNI